MLTFLLDHHGKDAINGRKRIQEQDLETYNKKTLIKTLQESYDEIMLMIGPCGTGAYMERAKVVQLLPKGFKCSVIVRDEFGTLLKAIKIFLELCNAKQITLRKSSRR
ncbi:hypothetical protein LR48_Vigan01g192800 [Vigna angularis]|uniref:Uncharacterized protein n=1 Tax=Phaseolus angularis TaxID=3914 RepID=A0A0L9TPH0_PHAAN|nr:hypothetical protein LR48_Vigan01g192800 [Vigna angularis]